MGCQAGECRSEGAEVNINLEKLDALEERSITGTAALRSLFDRYRARLGSASDKRQLALANKQAGWSYGHMSLAQLATVPPEELQAAGVVMTHLAAAFRDRRAADELLAEHGRQAATHHENATLVHSLRKFAGRG